MLKPMPCGAALLVCLTLGACAHSPVDDPSDPLEPLNRATYAFNDTLDRYVAKPAAKGYTKGVPEELRVGVHNFFNNLTYPTVVVNDALQGKFKQSGLDTTRFLVNTLFGLAGFLDPATMIGLESNDEDFGQTLGAWGVGQGWYLMLPFLGPSTNRDLVGRVGSAFTSPVTYTSLEVSLPTSVMNAVDTRAQLLGADAIMDQQLDRYLFIRSAYLQRRQSLVYDGNPPREVYDFSDDPESAPAKK